MNESLLNTIIKVLIVLESGGDPCATGDIKGDVYQAIGILQIHPIMVRDVNRILGKRVYKYKDRYDPTKSVKMCKIYLKHYASKDWKNYTSCDDESYVEYCARIWNGGLGGHRKKDTISYGIRALTFHHTIRALDRIDNLELFKKGAL